MVSRRQLLEWPRPAPSPVKPLARPAFAQGQTSGGIKGFDHVALPMQNTDAMLAFYRGLGLQVVENAQACSVYIGDQMINFHRPVLWQRESFTLRAPGREAAVRRSVLCVGWHAGLAETDAGPRRREDRGRASGPARRPPPRRVERLHARSGRQPAGVHDLLRR